MPWTTLTTVVEHDGAEWEVEASVYVTEDGCDRAEIASASADNGWEYMLGLDMPSLLYAALLSEVKLAANAQLAELLEQADAEADAQDERLRDEAFREEMRSELAARDARHRGEK